MKTKLFLLLLLSSTFSYAQIDEKSQQLIAEMETALGGWDQLWSQHDISYEYDYHYPGNGKKDISTERYIFEGEHSWAKYTQHDINVAPETKGIVIQSLVHGQPAVSLDGKRMMDEKMVGTADFLRRANYFWLTMFYKMDDPGVIVTYRGKEAMAGTDYEVVHVTYNPEVTGKPKNDEYILYLHPKTKLVDRFFFSLPAMGVEAPVILMAVEYQKINGVQLPTKRLIYQPGADGKLPKEAQLIQTLTQVSFNNGFTPEDFQLK